MIPGRQRPGIGRPPRTEARRPWLPQQARLCPPLEAGNALGWLLFPPLHDHEAFQIRRTGPGELQLAFFGGEDGSSDHLFTTRFLLPGSGTGVWSHELIHRAPGLTLSDDEISTILEALMRPQSLWAPAGAVALRGAYDLRTPPGWDLIFTGVLNQPTPPRQFTFTSRVQADWYPCDSEFRYLLEVGEILSGSGRQPVGQAFAVPRQDLTLEAATPDDIAQFRSEQATFLAEKLTRKQTSATGLQYDTLYRERSRRVDADETN
jgi:hypothetical protein